MVMSPEQQVAAAIGLRIRELRKERGWSQEKLAREMEMSRQTIYQAERGRRIPDWFTLFRMARALDVPIDELLRFFTDRPTASQLSGLGAAAA